jgi:hypothetical protein
MELLSIETYSDSAGNKVVTRLDKLHINAKDGQVIVICEDVQTGPAGNKSTSFTMIADNTTDVPVVRALADGSYEPVMIGEGEEAVQKHIGEFDMWKVLVFENNFVSLNDAIGQAILRRKGLINTPLAFVDPTA